MEKADLRKDFKIVLSLVGAAAVLLAPAASYAAFEYVTGNLAFIEPDMAALNILWYYAVYAAAFALLADTRASTPVCAVSFYLLSAAEFFVMKYRGTPLVWADISAASTAATVAGKYDLLPTPEMISAGCGILIICFLSIFSPLHVKKWRWRAAAFLGGAGFFAAAAAAFFMYFMPAKRMEMNLWEIRVTYEDIGYVLTSALSLKYTVMKPPAGYGRARLNEIEENVENGTSAAQKAAEAAGSSLVKDSVCGTQPVNIICIMDESLSDLHAAGDFETTAEYFPFLSGLRENTVRGNLVVPVFGSGTSNTEFEFLTSQAVGLLPAGTNAYQFYVKDGMGSLVGTLKSQGYRTLAMHPYPAANWNRERVYAQMGFDEFLAEEAYAGLSTLRTYITDQADFERLTEEVEKKKAPSERLFIFNVTMQNHGGYTSEDEKLEELEKVALAGEYAGKYPMTDQYLTLMRASDEAIEWLIQYFSGLDEPSMVVLFGDHQPAVEDDFYDDLVGMPSKYVSVPGHLIWYKTPFIIWTNYDQPQEDLGDLSACFLAPRLLSLAGLEMSCQERLSLALSAVLPVLHKTGCYDASGTWYAWEETEKKDFPYYEALKEYEILLHNQCADKNTLKKIFEVK